MEIPKSPKIPKKYTCDLCDYKTSNKKDYSKHLLTLKHQNNAKGNILEIKEITKSPKHTKYKCECGKICKTTSGIWKHKMKCMTNTDAEISSDTADLKNIVLEVVKNNNELQKQNQELTNKLFDICKNGNVINNNTVNNKTFNLNVFLNEQCKDAMNIMEFVDSVKLQLSDLESVGKLGFVEGMSNIIIKNLKSLEVHKRPVHCTDSKREILYVKDEDKWDKYDNDNPKIRKAIKHIAHKNSRNILLFKEKYPDCIYSDSKKSDQYNKIIIESMGGCGNEDYDNENKIIKKLTKEVIINK